MKMTTSLSHRHYYSSYMQWVSTIIKTVKFILTEGFFLKKLTKTWAYLFNETEVCEELKKQMEGFYTIRRIVDAGLISPTVITERFSIPEIAKAVDLPAGNALSGTSLLFSLVTAFLWKLFKISTIK